MTKPRLVSVCLPRAAALLVLLVSLCSLMPVNALAQEAAAKRTFDVPAGDARPALRQFAQQAKQEIVFEVNEVAGISTHAIKGEMTPVQALDAMLADTGLVVTQDNKTGAFAVRKGDRPNAPRAALTEKSDRPETSSRRDEEVVRLGEFEVFGSKLINLDIPRTRDEAQPYVVFDKTQIQNSQATNLGDFFRTRLPMATPNGATGSVPWATAGTVQSNINLRGLGTNQTLVLLDGRPMTNGGRGNNLGQADLNGIPISMIERVEILPSTASGIYGGGATGGVINVITRKDFSGAVLTLNYVNTFDTDSGQRQVDLTASTGLRGGATVITLTASYGDANAILTQDRDFAQRARNAAFANNPALFKNASSPPRGSTTNIRNQNGQNLVLKPQYGGTTLSSPFTSVPVGYVGIASDNAAALVTNAGRYNLALPNDTFGARQNLLTTDTPRHSLGLSVRQKLTPWLEGYADYLRTEHSGVVANLGGAATSATLAATAPNNPFTTAVNVSFPVTGTVSTVNFRSFVNRISSGLVAKLPGGWQAALDYTWTHAGGDDKMSGRLPGAPNGVSYRTAYSNGSLDLMRDINAYPLDFAPYLVPPAVSEYNRGSYKSINQTATVRASGPVYRLPAGDVVLSTSANWQDDRTPDNFYLYWDGVSNTALTYTFAPGTSVTNRAAYAEMRVPVLAPRTGMTQPLLELQVAGRYDASRARTYLEATLPTAQGANGPYTPVTYLTRNFSATSYTTGLRFAPLPDLTLRASAGTGFLAPARSQMSAGYQFLNYPPVVTDPKRGGVPASVIIPDYKFGGSPNLRPEHSKSISAGAIFTPRFVPGFRLSADYTKIDKTDEITSIFLSQAFFYEDALPGLITRAPLTPADQALGYTGGVVQALDLRSVNIARRKVEAVDVQADYTRKFSLGEFRFYGVATWNRTFRAQVTPQAAPVESVGFFDGPLKWNGNGGIDWQRGPWSAGWNAHYYGKQHIYTATATAASVATSVLTQGAADYPAQFYHDVQVAYQFGRGGEGWRKIFSDLRLSVGLQNAFNTEPPLRLGDVTAGGFQPVEDPRLRRYTLNLQKRF